MAKIINPTKVVTGKNTRFSYLIVNEPKAINGGTPKYSVSLIIPKSDTVTVEKIKAAIKAAYEEGQGKLKGNGKTVPPLKAIKTPLRDGDSPYFAITLMSVAIDDGAVQLYDLANGDRVPKDILTALTDESVIKRTFNVQFERVCLSRYLREENPEISTKSIVIIVQQTESMFVALPTFMAHWSRQVSNTKRPIAEGISWDFVSGLTSSTDTFIIRKAT